MKCLLNLRTYSRKVLGCHYYKHWLSINIKRIMHVGFSSVCYTFHWLLRQFRHFKFLTPFLVSVEGKLHFSTANTASWLLTWQLDTFTSTFPLIKPFNSSGFKNFKDTVNFWPLKEKKKEQHFRIQWLWSILKQLHPQKISGLSETKGSFLHHLFHFSLLVDYGNLFQASPLLPQSVAKSPQKIHRIRIYS